MSCEHWNHTMKLYQSFVAIVHPKHLLVSNSEALAVQAKTCFMSQLHHVLLNGLKVCNYRQVWFSLYRCALLDHLLHQNWTQIINYMLVYGLRQKMCDGHIDRWTARQMRPKTIVTIRPLWAEATNNNLDMLISIQITWLIWSRPVHVAVVKAEKEQ